MTSCETEIVLAVVRCGERICVVRRSQLVGTSRGLWSVVTGYVEPGVEPAEQAWREVDEELALRPPGLRLRGRLDAVPLSSPASGKRFLVYPFLFDCASTSGVTLNWEHDEFQWVQPAWLDRPECVPWQAGLVRALLFSDWRPEASAPRRGPSPAPTYPARRARRASRPRG